jgi:hypothetical protein
MHSAWQAQSDPSKPDLDAIVQSLHAANPACKAWLPALATYTVSTDSSGQLLRELAHCAKTMTPKACIGQGRFVGSEFFERLNLVKASSAEDSLPYLKNAVLKAQLTGHVTVDTRRPHQISACPLYTYSVVYIVCITCLAKCLQYACSVYAVGNLISLGTQRLWTPHARR